MLPSCYPSPFLFRRCLFHIRFRFDKCDTNSSVKFELSRVYKYKLNDYIAINSGLIWLTAPAQNNQNNDAIIGIVRTTFTF
ncbi:carbohydrate porin [Planktothrix sp. PCC 11201]|uniref:carbohydrate porin n=1 Tax=Planktothrix sp. PCC 11201 TaxID=1729650 RepID=UPI0009A6FC68